MITLQALNHFLFLPNTGYFPPLLTRFPQAPKSLTRPTGTMSTLLLTAFECKLGIYSECYCLGYGGSHEGGAQWSPPGRMSSPPPHSCSLLPSLSPASANICNVVLMRYGELEEGIDVLDGDGNLVGSSKIAARHVGPPRARGLGVGSNREAGDFS